MRKKLLLLSAIAFSGLTFGQVGINTPTPIATLDVTAKATDGTTSEGIIAPRLTGDQIKAADSNYTAAQTAAIVYALSAVTSPTTAKTANITSAGYYYFDGTLWQKMMNSAMSGGLYTADGTLTGNRTVTMGGKTLKLNGGFVGIGTETPKRLLHLSASDEGTPTMLALDNIFVPPSTQTSSNGMSISFRGTLVNAAGATTTFKELAAIQVGYQDHNATTPASSFRFYTSGTGGFKERVRISNQGYLGVGTQTPTSPLQVVGLPKHSSDANAGNSGLTEGAFYQTDGTGTGIFAFHGVVMVKQPPPPLVPTPAPVQPE